MVRSESIRKSAGGAMAVIAVATLPLAAALPLATAWAQQPYAGQEQRAISTLSASDIAELERGGGWGLAKPAELNGYPGPAHVLELADKLELTPAQKKRVETIFRRMQMRAKSIGARYISAEAAIDALFKNGKAYNGGALNTQLKDAERLRTELRLAHLDAHISTAPVLTAAQLKAYAELRGYAGAADAGQAQGHGNGQGHGPHMKHSH